MSVQREIMRGTAWMVSARWAMRALGVISTIILARIIAPKDYGLVALATLVTGMVGIFGEVGLFLYLIREPNIEKSHFDTVWSLRMLIGAGLALIILLVAPFAGGWFGEPDVVLVVQCLALPTLLLGLQNPGIALFRKNLDFRKDFQFLLGQKLAAFIAMVSMAFILRNYWALVIGIVTGSLTALVQSYLMHPMRPHFDLSRTRDVWRFSTWTLVYSLVNYLAGQVPTLVLGRMRSASEVGLYNVADDLATAPVNELAQPMGRVLMPAYSKIAHDANELSVVFAKVFSTMAILTCSVCVGVSLVAHDAVAILLGARWVKAAPLVEVLALAGALGALAHPIQPLLIALGRPQTTAYLQFAQLTIAVPLMIGALLRFDLPELALAQGLTLGLTLTATIAVIVRVAGISLRVVLASIWRPVIAGLLMWPAVRLAQDLSPDIPLTRLCIAALVGAAAFSAALLGTWWASGCPKTIEFEVLMLVRKAFVRASA